MQEVAASDVDGVHPQLHRGHVDDAFEHGGRFGPARAAVRAHRCQVGEHHCDVVPDRGNAVDALRHHPRGAERQHAAEPPVGAGVADDATPQPDDGAVVAEPQLDVLHLTAPVGHRHHVLGAGLHPLHGATEFERDLHRDDVLGRPVLGAERTAHVRGDQAHRVGLEPEARGEPTTVHVGHLAPEVDGELVAVAVAVVAGDDRDRGAFHGHHGEALVLEPAAHDHVGAREGVVAVGLASAHDHVGTDGVELQRRIRVHRRLHVGHRRECVVVDDHRVRGVDGLRLGLRHHDDHRVTHVAHLVARQRGTDRRGVQLHHRGVVREVEVVGRVHRDDARHRAAPRTGRPTGWSRPRSANARTRGAGRPRWAGCRCRCPARGAGAGLRPGGPGPRPVSRRRTWWRSSACSSGGGSRVDGGERPAHEHPGEMATELGGRVEIRRRFGTVTRPGGRVGR